MTIPELRIAAIELYRRMYAAQMRGEHREAEALKRRADFLNITTVTKFRMPELEALALRG